MIYRIVSNHGLGDVYYIHAFSFKEARKHGFEYLSIRENPCKRSSRKAARKEYREKHGYAVHIVNFNL